MERQRETRTVHDKRVLLEFSATIGFIGTTRNISDPGALVIIPHPPHGVNEGDKGIFRIMSDVKKYSFSFQLVRMVESELGIRFLEIPDKFVIKMLREI